MATGKPSFLYKNGPCMTEDARWVKIANKDKTTQQQAEAQMRREGGDPSDETLLLSGYTLQVGQYYGNTFKWLLENFMISE